MRVIDNRCWKPVAAALAALTLSVCGGDSKPSTPTQPIVAPTSSPTPVTPTPEPPLSASCARLSPGATKASCRDDTVHFEGEVDDAIDALKREQPRIFDGDQVIDVGAYVVGVMKELDRKGICGDWDGEELGVARNSNLSDHFDILTARSQVRRHFVGTCYPSLVPVRHRRGVPPPAGCPLPSSVEISCGEPPSRFVDKMLAAIERVIAEKPEIFDFSERSPQGWPRVKDMQAYFGALIEIFGNDGFCARFDGEEMVVKRTNDFTEHFAVKYQDKYVRKGRGIYRGACYPAAF
jgi:hypothetical protein